MRSTRRGFGRRALSFGLAIFCAITLMSVGFAAWVLSNNASIDSTGGIKTETITDKSVNIVITNAGKDKVLYDSVDENGAGTGPQNLVFGHLPVENPDANKGFIQTDGEKNESGLSTALNEDLQFVVKGTVDNIDKIGELHFHVRVPDSLLKAAGLSIVDYDEDNNPIWAYDPAKAFIRLPSFARDSQGHQIPYITGTYTDPDADGNISYEYGWDGSKMTEDVLWVDPSALLTEGKQEITDLDGNKYTIKYVDGRTDKLEFELKINFQWGARYLGMNPNYFYDVAERATIGMDKLTTVAPHTYTTDDMNMVNYDLLLLQAVINGLELENYLTANTIDENEVYQDTGIVLAEGQTLEDYIKANPDGIKVKLAKLQQNIETAIANLGKDDNHKKAPIYEFWIYADVK